MVCNGLQKKTRVLQPNDLDTSFQCFTESPECVWVAALHFNLGSLIRFSQYYDEKNLQLRYSVAIDN